MLNSQILKPATVNAIAKLGLRAEKVADRWASGWKAETTAMEAAGTLLPRLQAQADKEAQILAEARQGGENSHLADHEILALNDLSPAP